MDDIIVYTSAHAHPPIGFTADVCGWHETRAREAAEAAERKKQEEQSTPGWWQRHGSDVVASIVMLLIFIGAAAQAWLKIA